MKPYNSYIDTGIGWIGKVPDHWTQIKLRTILKPVNIRNRPDLPLLSVVREKGVIKRDINNYDENHNYIPDDLTNYKLVNAGQFAMNKMKAWQGSYGISNYDGIVSPAYFVFNVNKVLPKFLHIALRSKAYVPFFTQSSDGVRVGQWDLNLNRMKEIPFWIPPPEEQTQIARYLDWKTAQINKFIRAKKRMIELLKEKKQAIINDAVTGKIDVRTGKSYDKYKGSTIKWLPMVPSEWNTFPLKRLVKSNSETLTEKTDPEFEFRYLEINQVKSGYIISAPERIAFKNAPSRARRIVKKGDTIISNVRTYLRSVLFLDFENCNDLIVSTGFSVLTPTPIVNDRFLGYLLRSDNFIDRVIMRSIGVSYPAISNSNLVSLNVYIPSLPEQSLIVNHIEKYSRNLDSAISKFEREINLMKEYKARLISDAVTGKIDIRSITVSEINGDKTSAEINDIGETVEITENEQVAYADD